MVDDNNKLDTESNTLNNLKKYHNKPNSVISDITLLQLSGDISDDFKALGKVKLEDLDIQETMLQLEEQFDRFIIEQAGLSSVIQKDGYNDAYNYSLSNVVDHTEDLEIIEESLLQKILDFFVELSENSEADVYFEYELNPLERKKRKKRFILLSIIEFLKKLLRANRRLNLKELIEQQILELQERLSKEQDPELRKLLHERLILLMQLKAMLIEKGITSSLLISCLLTSSIISSVIRLQGEASVGGREHDSLLRDLSKLLLLQQKDPSIVNETIANTSQVSPVVSLSSILNAQSYISDTFRGCVKEVSHKLQDQYYMIHRDHISVQQVPNVGMFAVVYAIMRAVDYAVGKVKDAVSKVFHSDRSDVPVMHRRHSIPASVKPASTLNMKSESVGSYDYKCSFVNVSQSVTYSTQSMMGYMSSYSYHSEYRFSSMEIKNNSYLDSIKVKEMSQTCSTSQSLKLGN
ncbi:hypothetical protein EHRUM4_06280 [Ehrlichia ruminantium]|uniref:Uncharacterized protein n=1 Tax=Ehrlichia ruminantium TaxID=779 RepID=A0A170QU23_EHRRU|nr:hypothetical protein [Ehrlichia ruminantium]GAT75408.1 hypothetical protein EHRUM4_06280 [Ehrlichia ruminantium]GAT77395.1 hypothetical protein EHRUM2_06180 [Ehrlichia ruminantium]